MSFIFHVVFYQPILNLLVFFYNIIPTHDLGLAIIVVTVLIKLILFPLSQQSIKSQKQLQEIQPKIEEAKSKFANNKEEMARATMALYKEHKVNPFSSCLPLLVQLPFFFAVFQVFRDFGKADAMKYVYKFNHLPEIHSTMGLLGLIDLSKPNYLLAILAGLAQFWQAKMFSTKKPEVKTNDSKDENMAAIMNKQMLYMMPALTIFIGFTLPSGLSLYWFVTTILTVLQQIYVFKHKLKKQDTSIISEIVK